MLPDDFARRLSLPLIVAPMTGVSSPELVLSVCRHGAMCAFPTHNAQSLTQLDDWCARFNELLGADHAAPWIPNLIVHRSNRLLEPTLACLVEHRPPAVVTSVGSPQDVVGPLQEVGTRVWADVASMRHVERALASGVDGLVLLTAGAGGRTGWLNPFAFVRAVRQEYTGTIILAGGVSDGAALRAAQELGSDLAYMGTCFIPTLESRASREYKHLLIEASADDVVLTSKLDGLPSSVLRTSPGFDQLDHLAVPSHVLEPDAISPELARIYSAGHSVDGVRSIVSAEELLDRLVADYGGDT